MAALWTHYLPEWRLLLNNEDIAKLTEKFGRGYLDLELQEKFHNGSPILNAKDFRFLHEYGVQAG